MAETFTYNEETKELQCKGREYKSYPGGLGKMFYDRLKELANNPEELIAQIQAETGFKQTYKEFFHKSIKVAQYLKNIGIKPGDIVSICSYNNFCCGIVAVAIQFVGAIMASTDPILSLEDTKYLLDMVKPKVIFVSEGSETLIYGAIKAIQLNTKLITFGRNYVIDFEPFNEIRNVNVDENFEPFYATDLDGICTVLFSSGTTGMPKGICLSHNYFVKPLTNFPPVILKQVMLYYSSLYWISSVYHLIFAIKLGNARLLCKKFEQEKHWKLAEKYNVSYILLSNTYCIEALKYLSNEMEFPNLNILSLGGGIIPEKDLAEVTSKLPNTNVAYVYALTEGALVAQSKKGDKLGSVGKPVNNNQIVKIVDPDTEEALPLNKIGEIRIKSETQMNGYYNVDSSDAWDKQGFLKTGDLGYLDDDFYLFVVDRIKEMFKYRSWHVVPAKIENVLYSYKGILYAAVLGKPTYNEDENHAMAIVCLQDGVNATREEIEAFVNEQLDEINEIRAGVKIVDKSLIKFTPTGKINRRLLKEMFISSKK